MNYSPEYKKAITHRMLPPNNESVTKIAKEEGLSEQTLRNWRDKARREGLAALWVCVDDWIWGIQPIAFQLDLIESTSPGFNITGVIGHIGKLRVV